MELLINQKISNSVLMLGVYYKNSAPGGMAAVIQYYSRYFSHLNYIPTWRLGTPVTKLYYFASGYVKTLWCMLFDRKIRIVHIHTAADTSFWRKMVFVHLAKYFKKKVIIHVHASRFKDFYNESNNKEQIRRDIMQADKLVVLSRSWKEWFCNIGIPEKHIAVLNNIIDYPNTSIPKENLNIPTRMLFMGEIGDRKGIFDILKALCRDRYYYNGKLEFRIGGNRNEQQLSAFIKENDLTDFVKFEGWVTGVKKIQLLTWANVFVLPSYNEGLPISILEAMSYECAVIASPVGGIPEVVHNGENGIIVQPGDIDGIETAIKEMVDSQDLVKQYGRMGISIVKPYLPNQVFSDLIDIYKELLW
ncbi:MAG: glycosyltransferase family 4 protein [Bacteroides sp.]|nr:glycosyltransferase family 4 protein [Bacteroides sp.]